ncbi:MAG TPA: ribose-phosphate pyrophosphokinase, partial [Campylobacterales bacterium]|nr:ribose-phosphate pyrophosphokinase [Campylobacterales bacterium]
EKGELDELVITDTIPHNTQSPKVTVLTVSSIFGEVIRRVYHNESVNSLFLV